MELREGGRGLDWLPVMLWILVPIVSWVIVGNLLEATVTAFVTAAVASLVAPAPVWRPAKDGRRGTWQRASSSDSPGWRERSTWMLAGAVSGLSIVAATLTKGPVGLFPLAAPLVLAMLPQRRTATPWLIASQWSTVVLCAVVMLAMPAARQSLNIYTSQQVLATLTGERGTTGTPLTTAMTLLAGVALPLALVSGILRVAAGRRVAADSRERRIAAAFILLGLAGSLPIMFSPRQTGHYVVPAIPFYAIGAAAAMCGVAQAMVRRLGALSAGTMRAAAATVVVGAIAAARAPALGRDADWLAELDRMAAWAPHGSTVAICGSSNGNWLLHAWMQRRFAISLDASGAERDWFLRTGDDRQCVVPPCAPVSPAGRLVLLRCR
jgi:hypothetical protein